VRKEKGEEGRKYIKTGYQGNEGRTSRKEMKEGHQGRSEGGEKGSEKGRGEETHKVSKGTSGAKEEEYQGRKR
jgi:hypothetical protein